MEPIRLWGTGQTCLAAFPVPCWRHWEGINSLDQRRVCGLPPTSLCVAFAVSAETRGALTFGKVQVVSQEHPLEHPYLS